MTEKSIGVGIVGLSASAGWAGLAHVPALQALPRFQLRGLTASSPASAEAAAKKYGVPYFSDDPAALARRDDIDLVVIAVKVPDHRNLLDAVMQPGKAVYCEWPLGNGLQESAWLVDEARRRGVRGFVGLQARSAPPVCHLRDLIADGYVGQVLSTHIVGSGDGWGPNTLAGKEYLLDVNNGATMLTIPAGHTLDAACMVLGELQEMSATLAVRRPFVHHVGTGQHLPMTAHDQVCVSGVLEGGTVLNLHYRGGKTRGVNFLWEINGTEGDLALVGNTGHLQYGQVSLRGGRGADRALKDLPLPPAYHRVDLAPHLHAYTVAHAYRKLLDEWDGAPSDMPTFETALRAHQRLELIESAARTGQRLRA